MNKRMTILEMLGASPEQEAEYRRTLINYYVNEGILPKETAQELLK